MIDTFFTIGHSTRSLTEFADLLRSSDIQLVVDVRTVPRSRTNPQFNRESLPDDLAPFQIGYEHVAELGGLRGKQCTISASPNRFWQNQSFRNYADYAITEPFQAGLAHLRLLGHERRSVIMCAEAVWWRCHRRIIADHLLMAGEGVFHILGKDHVDAAKLTSGAKKEPDGSLIYPVS